TFSSRLKALARNQRPYKQYYSSPNKLKDAPIDQEGPEKPFDEL
ncbi:hypothetical protein BMETH_24612553881947, partial [methanotrophic bacterial endosymbiont of Bathymodiolus sp.]